MVLVELFDAGLHKPPICKENQYVWCAIKLVYLYKIWGYTAVLKSNFIICIFKNC